MIYYALRHKASGELMPQLEKGRGYSHWNPSNPNSKLIAKCLGPRLLKEKKVANMIQSLWASQPNLERHISYSFEGSEDYGLRSHPDNRTKDDLEVVEVELILK